WRSTTSSPNPGAAASMSPSTRETTSGAIVLPCGTWVYAHTVAVPSGERDGSATFIWPTTTNGRLGDRPAARSVATSARWSEPSDEGGGQLPRATFGNGVAVLLAQAAEQPTEEPAERAVGRQIGVERVPGQQHRRAAAAEVLLREPAHRQRREACEVRQVAAQLRRQRHRGTDRGERAEQGVDDVVTDRRPLTLHVSPRVAVTEVVTVERLRRLVDVLRQHDGF